VGFIALRSAKFGKDRVANGVCLAQDFVVPEPKHPEAL
jgi:hypothetical protein